MASVQQVLAVAAHEVDLHVVEMPRGSNCVKYNDWYYGRHVSGSQYAWCAAFVSWVAAMSGAANVIPRHAYTVSGASWFQSQGAWGATPRVGAIVYFRWPGIGRISHVGIVESIRPDGSIVTIEGNTDEQGGRTGGCVMRKIRHAYIAGYGYPAYGGQSSVIPPYAPAQAGKLVVDGDFGPATVRRLQQSLNSTGARPGLAVDGGFGPMSKRALQGRLHQTNGPVAVDGVLGPQTTRALQRNVGASVDGQWGPMTTSALQRTLNARNL